METALIKRVSDIIKQDSLKEIQIEQDFFCNKMNDLFSLADGITTVADVSAFISALHSTTSMEAIIPTEILEGLKNGIYKFQKSDGEFLAQIVTAKGNKIVKNLRLKEVCHLSNPAGISNLSMQIATQMKLSEIQGLIEDLSVQVNRKLNSIIQNQVDTIIAKAEAALIKFEDYRCHPELNIEVKDVKSDVDEVIALIKRDIQNRIGCVSEIENRKKEWWIGKTVKTKDLDDSAKNVSFVQEEAQYLQILFMVKFYLTKDIQDLKDYSDYLSKTFTEKCYYMLNTWESRPKKMATERLEYFWVDKFPVYLNQIQRKTNELLALEEKNYE